MPYALTTARSPVALFGPPLGDAIQERPAVGGRPGAADRDQFRGRLVRAGLEEPAPVRVGHVPAEQTWLVIVTLPHVHFSRGGGATNAAGSILSTSTVCLSCWWLRSSRTTAAFIASTARSRLTRCAFSSSRLDRD